MRASKSSRRTENRFLRYSIVIPAYNEGARIAASLDKILRHAAESHWDAEIIVVDDGSSDETAELVRSRMRDNPSLRLLANPGNRGKGYSVRNGMLHAQGEILLFSDADLSSPIEEADKLFAALAAGADVAIGSRWVRSELQTEKQPVHRRFLGRMFNLALRIILGLKFKDTQCGFKAFTRRAACELFPMQQIEGWGFDPELLFMAKRFDLRVAEVPVRWAHSGLTRIHPVKDGTRMFWDALRIRWFSLSGKYELRPARQAL